MQIENGSNENGKNGQANTQADFEAEIDPGKKIVNPVHEGGSQGGARSSSRDESVKGTSEFMREHPVEPDQLTSNYGDATQQRSNGNRVDGDQDHTPTYQPRRGQPE